MELFEYEQAIRELPDRAVEYGRALRELPSDFRVALTLGQPKLFAKHLHGATQLVELILRGGEDEGVTDETLAELRDLPNLRILEIVGPHVTDAGVAELKDLPSLESMRLAGTRVTGAGLAPLVQLKSLDSWRTGLTDEGMKSVAKMTSLEKLRLGGEGVTGKGLAALAALPALRELIIYKCEGITGPGLEALAQSGSLQHLDLSSTSLSDEAMQHVGRIGSLPPPLSVSPTHPLVPSAPRQQVVWATRLRSPSCVIWRCF